MGQLILTVAGQAIGAFVGGPIGAAIGGQLGSVLGAAEGGTRIVSDETMPAPAASKEGAIA